MDEQSNMNVGTGESKGNSAGPVVGIVVILAIIILGGLYFWVEQADDSDALTNKVVESINTQSNSDEAAAIEADLDATDIENLDAELNAS